MVDIPKGWELEDTGQAQAAAPQVAQPSAAPTAQPAQPVAPAIPQGWELQSAPAQPQQGPVTLEQMQDTLRQMVADRKTPDEITGYLKSIGAPELSKEDQATLADYGNFLQQNPNAKPNLRVNAQEAPTSSAGGSAFRGAQDIALMGGADELATLGNYLGRGLGLNQSTTDWDTTLNLIKQERDQQIQADAEQHPMARLAGQGAGFAASIGMPYLRAARGANWLGRLGASAATGLGYGAASGALSDNEDRGTGAVTGGAVGLGLGTALPLGIGAVGLGVRSVGNALRPIGERLGWLPGSSSETSGLNALARRYKVDPAELQQRAQAFRDAGITDYTLADLLPPSGRDIIATAARRNLNARDTAEAYARGRAVNLPERVQGAADIISPSQQTPTQLTEQIRAQRSAIANEEYDAIRSTPVPVTEDLRRVLDTGAGRRALKDAIETSDSPEEIAGFLSSLKRSNEPSELDRMMAMLPENMAPEAKEQVRQQLLSQGIQGGEPLAPFNLDMLDRVKRRLQAISKQPDASGRSRQYQKMVDTLVQAGDKATDGAYGTARGNFEEASGLMEATDVGRRFLPAGGRANPTDFANDVGQLTPDESALARAAAAEEMRTAAGTGTRGALSTARSMTVSPNQAERTTALVGPEQAKNLSNRLQAELDLFDNAQQMNPRAGSATALRVGDDAELGDMAVSAAISAKTGGLPYLARTVYNVLRNAGMRNVDAERLVRDSLDPRRTNDAIAYLTRRVGKNQARDLVGTIRNFGQRLLSDERGGSGPGKNPNGTTSRAYVKEQDTGDLHEYLMQHPDGPDAKAVMGELSNRGENVTQYNQAGGKPSARVRKQLADASDEMVASHANMPAERFYKPEDKDAWLWEAKRRGLDIPAARAANDRATYTQEAAPSLHDYLEEQARGVELTPEDEAALNSWLSSKDKEK